VGGDEAGNEGMPGGNADGPEPGAASVTAAGTYFMFQS